MAVFVPLRLAPGSVPRLLQGRRPSSSNSGMRKSSRRATGRRFTGPTVQQGGLRRRHRFHPGPQDPGNAALSIPCR